MAGSLQRDKIDYVRYGKLHDAGAGLMTKAQEKHIDDLKARLGDAMDVIAQLKSDLKSARKAPGEALAARDKARALEENNARLSSEMAAVRSENDAARSANANLMSKVSSSNRELTEARMEIDRLALLLEQRADEMAVSLAGANGEIERLKGVVALHKSPLSNTERGEMARLKAALDLAERERAAQ